jgi:uncharacterized lipoprotein NlpE involved in copper resistance
MRLWQGLAVCTMATPALRCRLRAPSERRRHGTTRRREALATALGGCMSLGEAPASAAAPVDSHNSRNSLDWAGTYEGVLPCADCPGIKMRLVLNRDGRFELNTQYLDRQVVPQAASGRFSWNSAGNTITLDAAGASQQFRVGEGRLLQLNRDGSAPPWSAANRVLTLLPKM